MASAGWTGDVVGRSVTALNIWVRGNAAHLLTDGATYDDDGTLVWIGSKVIASPSHPVAIAYSGRCWTGATNAVLAPLREASPSEIVRALPDAASAIRSASDSHRPGAQNDLQLAVALYDAEAGPQAWFVSTDKAWLDDGYRPGTAIRLAAMIAPPAPARPSDRFRARRDGLKLIEGQRQYRWPNGLHYVGGFGELTTVTAAGVHREKLVVWPDIVGAPIDPAVDGTCELGAALTAGLLAS